MRNSLKMKGFLFLSLMLHPLFHFAIAQDSANPTTTASMVSLTPQMSASAVSSLYSVLATSSSQQPGEPSAGDAASSAGAGDSNAGAAGNDSGSFSLSRGGIIAIIVVACSICIFGAVSAVLFYLAKKRDWQVRQSIRRSARRVATALTPRRSTFPRDVQKRKSSRGLTRIDEMPDTPRRSKSTDVEKANPKLMQFEMSEPPKKSGWGRKFGR